MMNINKLLKLSPKHKSNAGFTLIELLISSFMGVLIIGAAGYGLMNMLSSSKTSTAQTNKRTEFNRATEFISDEMRRADTIEVDPSTAFAAVPSPPANAQPVLALNIPGVTNPAVAGVDSPIIYFVSDPSGDDSSVWKGPKVIYRYGPPSDAQGNFTTGNWGLEPLVDGISADAVTPGCDNNWTASPPTGTKGFYACILPGTDDPNTAENESLQGETAKIFAVGKLDDGNYQSENYELSTQIYARAEAERLNGLDPDVVYDAACNFNTGAMVCPGGGDRTVTVSDLGSSMACKSTGEKWAVYVEAYYIDNSSNEVVLGDNSNGSFTFTKSENQEPLFRLKADTANSSECSGNVFAPLVDANGDPNPGGIQNQNFVSSADTAQFRRLEDADTINAELEQSYIDADGNAQDSARDTFTSAQDPDGNNLIDPYDNTKINLADGKYVLAFELGQTDPNVLGGGFDLNDHILLITVQK